MHILAIILFMRISIRIEIFKQCNAAKYVETHTTNSLITEEKAAPFACHIGINKAQKTIQTTAPNIVQYSKERSRLYVSNTCVPNRLLRPNGIIESAAMRNVSTDEIYNGPKKNKI